MLSKQDKSELEEGVGSQLDIADVDSLSHGDGRLFQFLEAIPVGVFVLDSGGKPYYANKSAQEMLGRGITPQADAANLSEVYNVYVAGTETKYPAEQMPIVRALAGERAEVQDMEIRRPGHSIMLEVSAVPIYDDAGKIAYAVASFNDVTRRRQAEEALINQAIRDPLTGVFNRRYLEETLERELHRAKRQRIPVGVVMVDIDHFKQFNDRFGHAIGDAVLQGVAGLLQRGVRAEDVVCRYGGEEFTLLLPGSGLATTLRRAEQLRDSISTMELPQLLGSAVRVTSSFGVVEYPLHGETERELMRAADVALYTAKARGRNQVVVAVDRKDGRTD